jgi:hypothetical protein
MKNYLFLFALLFVRVIQAKDIRYICNDHTIRTLKCDICDMHVGTMLLSYDGYRIDCICCHRLKRKTIACPLVAKNKKDGRATP